MEVDIRFKTFWQRVGANIIDGLIVGAASFAILVPVIVVVALNSVEREGRTTKVNLSEGEIALVVASISVISLASYAYTIGMLAVRGQTLGKMATGIIVLDAATGGRIGFRQAFLRSLGEMVIQAGSVLLALIGAFGDLQHDLLNVLNVMQSFSSYGWWLAEVLTMLTNPRRRALHDFIAGTVVVKQRYVQAIPAAPFAAPPADPV